MPVRIEAIDCEPLSVPLVDPFVIATGRVDATRSALVSVRVGDGQQSALGLGEASCFPNVTREDQPETVEVLQRVAPELVGAAFAELGTLRVLLETALPEHPVARAGLEMALLDGLALLEGVPLYRLLSPERRTAPEIVTDITLPILPVARMADLAEHWWAQGFRSFKVKVGRSLEDDLVALETIARRLPEARFRIDANGGYSAKEALRLLLEAQAQHLRLECFEQPCAAGDLRGLAEVARASQVPVIADESVKTLDDLRALLGTGAPIGVNLKLVKSGGLLPALELGRECKRRGLSLMVGGMVETRLGMTAAAHLVAALGGVDFPDLDTAWLLRTDPFDGGYRAEGPRYLLGDGPGLDIWAREDAADAPPLG